MRRESDRDAVGQPLDLVRSIPARGVIHHVAGYDHLKSGRIISLILLALSIMQGLCQD